MKVRWSVAVLVAMLPACLGCRGAWAQDAQRENGAILDTVNDIDKLRVIMPLKLGASQIDKIVEAVAKGRVAYNKEVEQAATQPLAKVADEIKRVKAAALTGAPIPKEFDDRIKKVQDTFLEKRKTAENTALKSLSDAVRAVLTPAQIKTAADSAKVAAEELAGGSPLKGTEAQWFNAYVLNVLIRYDRIDVLLGEVKSAGAKEAVSK
ncbi:MAG: hypothetical protein NT029_16095 [Armatimonadetes bacterium]|nr:hypothetical protein [Armatimonadota bacterium]